MMRINLFDPVQPSKYGTATPREILEVCLAALLCCAAMSLITIGLVYLLLPLLQ